MAFEGAFPQGGARDRLFWQFFRDAQVLTELAQTIHAGTWRPLQYLGRGGAGMVVLYGRFNTHHVLIDRAVVKETICNVNRWYCPLLWAGAYDQNGNRNYNDAQTHYESAETWIHRNLASRGADVIIDYRGRSLVDRNSWRYRLYTEFAAHRTLQDVIEYYGDMSNFPDLPEWGEYGEPDVLIPEAFIWYVFECLTMAAQIMETGYHEGDPIPDWKEVIHRDIKPQNILLDDPPIGPEAQWRLYPTPKLADFDLAVETTQTDPPENNPRAFRGPGTDGYIPPEQVDWYINNRDYHDTPPMSAATNVWAIGMVIYCLIFKEAGPEQLDYQTTFRAPQFVTPRPGYSHTLIDLMFKCLAFEPSERPTLDLIRRLINPKHLDADDMHFKGMRKVKPKAGQPWYDNDRGGKQRLEGFSEDDYRLGLTHAMLPLATLP